MRTSPRRSDLAVGAFVVFLLSGSRQSFAQPARESPSALPRLTAVAKLWGKVRYLHPYLYSRDVDWDRALVEALPQVRSARSTAEYRAAVAGMLAVLGDPVTRLRETAGAADAAKPEAVELIRDLGDGAVLLNLSHRLASAGAMDVYRQIGREGAKLANAREVIVDLRQFSGAVEEAGTLPWLIDGIAEFLASHPCRGPASRYLLHSGFAPATGSTSGGYYSGFLQMLATTYRPGTDLPVAPKKIAFVLDETSPVPPLALALQACGDGRIVAVGALAADAGAETIAVPLGEELVAAVRVSELLPGEGDIAADVTIPPADAARAVEIARAALARERTPRPGTPTLAQGIARPDPTYPEMTAPDLDHRQLAVIRAWNVIDLFYPYKALIGDWDAVLPEFLARMETAATGSDYARTILEMMNHVADGHTGVFGHPDLDGLYGDVPVPVRLRWIEERAVVYQVGEDAAKAGLAPGDAIVAIDGEPMAAAMARARPLVTASTEGALRNKLIWPPLFGKKGSTAHLTVEAPDGATREVAIVRDPEARKRMPPRATGDVVRLLDSQVGPLGYVDLTRLTVAEVDAMFEKIAGTRGLIFDMRGYPQGTAWSIAPRINTKHAKIGAQFRRAQVSAFSVEEAEAGFFFSQPLPELPPGKPIYDRPIAMIIDDRAISQSEHSGLFYEAASDIRFIGEPTAGANGDVTSFTLPGGIQVYFTGHDVRHADGRQLQRIGLVPDVPASPTRAGLAAGRDELLEAAIADLEARAQAPR